jgi:hypothetical protein
MNVELVLLVVIGHHLGSGIKVSGNCTWSGSGKYE